MGFTKEQEQLVLRSWNDMKKDSASIALKFFLRYVLLHQTIIFLQRGSQNCNFIVFSVHIYYYDMQIATFMTGYHTFLSYNKMEMVGFFLIKTLGTYNQLDIKYT
jgi:hypothetical protein